MNNTYNRLLDLVVEGRGTKDKSGVRSESAIVRAERKRKKDLAKAKAEAEAEAEAAKEKTVRKDEGALFDRLKDMAKAFRGRRKGGPEVERLKDDPKSTSSQRGKPKKPAWSDEKRDFNKSMGGDQR